MDVKASDTPKFYDGDDDRREPVSCEDFESQDDDDASFFTPRFSRISNFRTCSSSKGDTATLPIKRLFDNTDDTLHNSFKKSKGSQYYGSNKDADGILSLKGTKRPGQSADESFCLLKRELKLVQKLVKKCNRKRRLEKKKLRFIKRDIEECSIELGNKKKQVHCVRRMNEIHNKMLAKIERKEEELKALSQKIAECTMELETKEKELLSERKKLLKVISTRQKHNDCAQMKDFESMKKQFEGKVNELESKEKQCEGRVEELESKLKHYEGRVKELESREKELEGYINEFLSMEEALESCKKELESEQMQLESREKEFETKEEKIKHQVKELEFKKQHFESQLKELESKENQLVGRVKEFESKKNEFEVNLRALVEEMMSKQMQIYSRMKVVESKEKQHEGRVKEHQSKERELEDRVKEFDSKEDKFKVKVKELDSKEKQHEGQVKEHQSKEREFEDRVKELESKENKFKVKLKELDSKEKQHEGHVKEHQSKEREFEDRVKELASKENKFKVKVKELDSKEKQHEGRVKEHQSKEKEFEDRVKELESKENKFKVKVKELDLKEKQFEGEVKELESKLNRFDGQLKEPELRWIQYEALMKYINEEKDSVASYMDDQSSPTIDGTSLLLDTSDKIDAVESLCNGILVYLLESSDPSRVVLDMIQNPIIPLCKKGDNAVIIDDCHIILLEQLMRISPNIEPCVREEALKLALDLKAYMKENTENSLTVLGFLLLLPIYGLLTFFNEDEVMELFAFVAQHKIAIELFGTLGFSNKVSDFVQNLIKRKQFVVAVRFSCAYNLYDKKQLVDMLREHVQNAKLICENSCDKTNSIEIKDKARDEEIACLGTVLQCILDNNCLESEDLLNQEIQHRILELIALKGK